MNPFIIRGSYFVSAVVVLLFTVPGIVNYPAWAESDLATKAKEKEAKKACLMASQYERGIDILAELYVDTNNPTYIYNQGRCYQQNEMHEKALGRFQEYERKSPNLSAEDLVELKKRIAECEARIAKLSPAVSPPARSEPKLSTASLGSQPEMSIREVSPTTSEPARHGRGLRITGAILSSVGILGIGTGVTINYLYSREGKENERNPKLVASEVATQMDKYRSFSWLSYGVGAAALATGVTLFILGSGSHVSEPAQEPIVSFLPTFSMGSTGLTLRGSF